MKEFPRHNEQLPYLRKIEGQIRGIQKMIEDNRYCVDILTQLYSITGAIHRVEDGILEKHIGECVVSALRGKGEPERQKKIKEIINLVQNRR